MASSITDEEIKILKKKLKAVHDRIKNNPEEAKKFLISAGILTKSGKLKKIYKS